MKFSPKLLVKVELFLLFSELAQNLLVPFLNFHSLVVGFKRVRDLAEFIRPGVVDYYFCSLLSLKILPMILWGYRKFGCW